MHCHWCLAHTNEVKEEIEFRCQLNLGEDIVYWIKYKSGWSKNGLGSNMFYACPEH